MCIQTLRGIGGVLGEVEATNCVFIRFGDISNSTADPLYREHLQLHNSILVKEIQSKKDSPDVLYPWIVAEALAIWVCSNALALALNDAIPLLVVVDMLVIKGRWLWWWGSINICHWSQPIARQGDVWVGWICTTCVNWGWLEESLWQLQGLWQRGGCIKILLWM